MKHEKNPRLWGALGASLCVWCMPLGIYTAIMSMKISSSLRVGDLDRVDGCVQKIKTCYKITGIVYAVLIVLAVVGVFVD